MSARAAEEAIEQTGMLLDGVRRLADELAQAANRLVEARAEIEADLAEARLLPGAELAAAAARAEAALTAAGHEVGADDDARGGDPLSALRRLDEAGTTLDQALSAAHEERAEGERASAQLDRTLLAARSGIAAASDFIATRRGAVGSDARTRLAEAQRHLDTAVGLARAAPVDALREAQQADVLAQEALRLARDDVQRWVLLPPRGGSSGVDRAAWCSAGSESVAGAGASAEASVADTVADTAAGVAGAAGPAGASRPAASAARAPAAAAAAAGRF